MDETTTAPTTSGRAASASSGDGQLHQGAGDNKARGHTKNMGPDVRCPRLHSDRRAESARHAAGVYQRAQTARNVVPRRRCPFSDVGASRRPRPQAQGRSIPPLSRAEDHDRSEGASNEQRQGNNGRVLRHVPMRRQRPPICHSADRRCRQHNLFTRRAVRRACRWTIPVRQRMAIRLRTKPRLATFFSTQPHARAAAAPHQESRRYHLAASSTL